MAVLKWSPQIVPYDTEDWSLSYGLLIIWVLAISDPCLTSSTLLAMFTAYQRPGSKKGIFGLATGDPYLPQVPLKKKLH